MKPKNKIDNTTGGKKNGDYYIVTFGFNGDEGYEVVKSKPIFAKSGQEAETMLKDQFESYEGTSCEIFSSEKQYATGGVLKGKQKNLDINKNGKIDSKDLAILRGEKTLTGWKHKKKAKMAKGGGVGKTITIEVAGSKKLNYSNSDIKEMIDEIDMYMSADNLPKWIIQSRKNGNINFPKDKKGVLELLKEIENSKNDVYINVDSTIPPFKHYIKMAKGGGIENQSFLKDYDELKNHIKHGDGYIDLDYLEFTWENLSNIPYSKVKNELKTMLKRDGLLANEDLNDVYYYAMNRWNGLSNSVNLKAQNELNINPKGIERVLSWEEIKDRDKLRIYNWMNDNLDENDLIKHPTSGRVKKDFRGTLSTDSLPYLLKDIPYRYQIEGENVYGTLKEIEFAKKFLKDNYNIDSTIRDKNKVGFKKLEVLEQIIDYAKGGGIEKVGKVMHEFKEGNLHSGKSGKIVKDRKQAIAIALSEAGLSKK